jgi:hypothetical protein
MVATVEWHCVLPAQRSGVLSNPQQLQTSYHETVLAAQNQHLAGDGFS